MSSSSTSTSVESVLCKGCRTVRPIDSFLCPVPDAGCYRVRQQCQSCITKSAKHYQAHREDLRATRQMRERQSERVTCACGSTILASYRERHYQTKRHRTIAALLLNSSRAVTAASTTQSPATDTAQPVESAPTPSPHRVFTMGDVADTSNLTPEVVEYREFLERWGRTRAALQTAVPRRSSLSEQPDLLSLT
jgi:hypothetical protein